MVTTYLSNNVNFFHIMPNIIAIIPARSGSKSIKNKNLKKVKGISLLERAIKFAKGLKNINRVIVSTDSEKYQSISIKLGAECPFIRPKRYSGDKNLDIEVFKPKSKKLTPSKLISSNEDFKVWFIQPMLKGYYLLTK